MYVCVCVCKRTLCPPLFSFNNRARRYRDMNFGLTPPSVFRFPSQSSSNEQSVRFQSQVIGACVHLIFMSLNTPDTWQDRDSSPRARATRSSEVVRTPANRIRLMCNICWAAENMCLSATQNEPAGDGDSGGGGLTVHRRAQRCN